MQQRVSQLVTIIILAITSGIITMWVSLWLSYQPMVVDNVKVEAFMRHGGQVPLSGQGGFPLMAFKYPVSPLGNNFPNVDAYIPATINLVFWMAIAFVVWWFCPRMFRTKTLVIIFIGLASLLTLFGVIGLSLAFD